ncbi:MAG TPA: VacB/RNase II family 3'-5' exoribonuclease [Stellaceae bacterium]|nr:VacB/RNase II family 3'-5' exoribonuclease [Stellaceae bacterium]
MREVETRLIRPPRDLVEREPAGRVIGVFRRLHNGGRIDPADRRDRNDYFVDIAHAGGASDGELVAAEPLPARRYGPIRLRVVERLGFPDRPGAISQVSIAGFEIPHVFPDAARAEAAAAQPAGPAGRLDLRDIDLVTIDGSDARDFDDAVWAEPDPDPENPGGWHLIVAIADVAHYVAPGSALDREARERGNSVYFPDRVVPMLPEALSNGLCSLQPGEDRACLVAELWIDRDGRKRHHRFARAVMRSAARLTYEAVQAARDGTMPLPLAAPRLAALYGAFAALDDSRAARGALALDLVEYRVVLDPAGTPVAVEPRSRLDSHKLIEEFMILANVAAAEELEARHRACLYRVHDAPDPDRLDALREALADIDVPGLGLAKGQVIRPALFNRVLAQVAGRPEAPVVNDLVLRAQAQAVYSPHNIGHFGLALRRYAHFTSPIRRYADLVVHRALLGESFPVEDLDAIGKHVSATERRAAAAERAAIERYRAQLLGARVGEVFDGRVNGVQRYGLFVTLAGNGADGLLPLAGLPPDFYRFDARKMRLVGRHSRREFGLGDAVTVRLAEADPLAGRLVFRIDEPGETRAPAPAPHRRVREGRQLRRRRH